VKIHFLGVSSSINASGIGSSILIDDKILIDAPPACSSNLIKNGVDLNKITNVFISHLHGDHFMGLPILLLEYMLLNRTIPLNIYGDNKLEKNVLAFLSLAFPEENTKEQIKKSNPIFYDIDKFDDIPIGNININHFNTQHSPNSKGFFIRGKKNILFTSDTALFENLYKIIDESDEIILDGTTFNLNLPGHINYIQIKELALKFNNKRFFVVHRGKYDIDEKYDNIVFPKEGDIIYY